MKYLIRKFSGVLASKFLTKPANIESKLAGLVSLAFAGRRYIIKFMINLKIFKLLPVFLIALFSQLALSEDYNTGSIGSESFLEVQAILSMNSLIAANYPEEFGVLFTLISPFTAATEKDEVIAFSAVGGVASIGLYNAIELRKSKYSKSDIFKRNMIVLNAWYGAIYLLDLNRKDSGNSFDIYPEDDGLVLGFSYEF